MELFKAHNQWSTRPDDERFWTLQEMDAECRRYASTAKEIAISLKALRIEANAGEITLTGRQGLPAKVTHHAFGQLAQRVGAPAGYLRGLPATLAAQNINHGLAQITDDREGRALFHENGSILLRALTSDKYARIWNHEITGRLLDLEGAGWRTAPARPANGSAMARRATAADVIASGGGGGLKVNVGDMIAPAGLYASDHDMFAFLINETRRIDDGTDEGMYRGFFVENSEVGAGAFAVTTFLYRAVCGNHIVWGAKGVRELRIRHVGEAPSRAWAGIRAELREYADESVSDLEAKIKAAKSITLGATKDDVLSAVFGKRIPGLTRAVIASGYDKAEELREECGAAPNTLWGLSQGLTRASQESTHTDARTVIDVGVGKLLDSAF